MIGFNDPRGQQSEALAFQAERAGRAGRAEEARRLFAEAAALEEAIVEDARGDEPRVWSVLAVSAVALWYKAGDLARVEQLACRYLAAGTVLAEPDHGELRNLLQRSWQEAALAQHTPDAELLELQLDGGEVGHGLAPATLTRDRQAATTVMLSRVAEMLASKPFRRRGGASREVTSQLQIFEAPAAMGSYTVRLYVARGKQPQVPSSETGSLSPRDVIDRFLQIASAVMGDREGLRQLVPDEQYRLSFLSELRDLAPDGKHVASVTFRHASRSSTSPAIRYEPGHRSYLTQILEHAEPTDQVEVMEGYLKAVNLRSKRPKLELVERKKVTTIFFERQAFEDTIGQKLNRLVRVTCRKHATGTRSEWWAIDVALPDRDLMPWEVDARQAIERIMDQAEWDYEARNVALPIAGPRGDMMLEAFYSLDELRDHLEEVATSTWLTAVPFDASEPVFDADPDEIAAMVRDVLVGHTLRLTRLGWSLQA
jgi:hypothetical protein